MNISIQNFLSTLSQEYDWSVATIHLLVAIIIFYIVNWIGAHSIPIGYIQMSTIAKEDTAPAFNFLFKALSPVVLYVLYIVAVQSVGCQEFVQQSFLIILYYWIFRTIVILLLGHRRLANWPLHVIYWGVSMGLSIWIYSLIGQVDKLLPSPRSLLDQMWILIFMFIYSVFNNIEFSQAGTIKRKKNYIIHRFDLLKKEYGSLISKCCSNEFYEAATYAIMICEDFNRPVIIRWIEYIRFFITKKPHTLGIMQVRTDKYINNRISIIKGIDIIKKAAYKHKKEIKRGKDESDYDSPHYAIYKIAGIYNCNNEDYQSEVSSIFDTIESLYKNINDSYNTIEPSFKCVNKRKGRK